MKLIGCNPPMAQSRAGWTIGHCPLRPWLHEGKGLTFACKDEFGDAHTTCFACDWHGSMTKLVVRMQELNAQEHHVDVKWQDAFQAIIDSEADHNTLADHPTMEDIVFGGAKKITVFPEWWLDTFPKWRDVKFARDYLKQRGVADQLADQLDLRVDSVEMRVCFPIRDFAGRLVGLHGRAIDAKQEPRYRMYLYAKKNNPLVWLGESYVDTERPILVVEGPFDVASVLRVYDNSVSPLFATPSQEKISRMADAREWVTLLDRGKGGEAGRKKISKSLGKTHVITHLAPPAHRKDPGEMTEAELVELLSPHLHLKY